MAGVNLDNANWRMFTDFAAASGVTSARANLVGEGTLRGVDGGPRRVTVATNRDFVGNVLFRTKRMEDLNDEVRGLFKQTVADLFGGSVDDIPKSIRAAMKFDSDFDKGKPLTSRRISVVKAAVEQYAKQNFCDSVVTGKGTEAMLMKETIGRCIDVCNGDPETAVKTRFGNFAKGLTNWTICSELKKLNAGAYADSQFFKDISRGLRVKIPGTGNGGSVVLANDFETAANQMARYVANDPQATFAGLNAKQKGKVHLMMALANQEQDKALFDGFKMSIDPAQNRHAVFMNLKNDSSTREVEFKRTDNGDLLVTSSARFNVGGVFPADEGLPDFSQASQNPNKFLDTAIDYRISDDEVNRLLEVDMNAVDDEAVDQAFGDTNDATGRSGAERVVDALPENCRFTPGMVSATVTELKIELPE